MEKGLRTQLTVVALLGLTGCGALAPAPPPPPIVKATLETGLVVDCAIVLGVHGGFGMIRYERADGTVGTDKVLLFGTSTGALLKLSGEMPQPGSEFTIPSTGVQLADLHQGYQCTDGCWSVALALGAHQSKLVGSKGVSLDYWAFGTGLSGWSGQESMYIVRNPLAD